MVWFDVISMGLDMLSFVQEAGEDWTKSELYWV